MRKAIKEFAVDALLYFAVLMIVVLVLGAAAVVLWLISTLLQLPAWHLLLWIVGLSIAAALAERISLSVKIWRMRKK